MLTGIGGWFYRYVAGIRTEGPGYSSIVVQPSSCGDLTHINSKITTMAGDIAFSYYVRSNPTNPHNSRDNPASPSTWIFFTSPNGPTFGNGQGYCQNRGEPQHGNRITLRGQVVRDCSW